MGKFVKGQSGNPSGRPRDGLGIRQLAQERSLEALEALTDIMNDNGSPPAARVSAAVAILDRAYGKPAQQIKHSADIDMEQVNAMIAALERQLDMRLMTHARPVIEAEYTETETAKN